MTKLQQAEQWNGKQNQKAVGKGEGIGMAKRKDAYDKIRCCRFNGKTAFRADGILYFFDEDDLWSRECARLAAEWHSGPTPDYLIESIDQLGDGQFQHVETGEVYPYPRGSGSRRRVALDYAMLREAKRTTEQPAAVLQEPGNEYFI